MKQYSAKKMGDVRDTPKQFPNTEYSRVGTKPQGQNGTKCHHVEGTIEIWSSCGNGERGVISSADGRLLTFTLRPSCCILAAQKKAKYRDSLVMGQQGYYCYPNPLIDPGASMMQLLEAQDRKEVTSPRMPARSGVVEPPQKRKPRLSDSYFKLEDERWIPQVVYETSQVEGEIQRRLQELVEYMKWRCKETLEAYEHYFDAARHAETLDVLHTRMHQELERFFSQPEIQLPLRQRKVRKHRDEEVSPLPVDEPDLNFLYQLGGDPS